LPWGRWGEAYVVGMVAAPDDVPADHCSPAIRPRMGAVLTYRTGPGVWSRRAVRCRNNSEEDASHAAGRHGPGRSHVGVCQLEASSGQRVAGVTTMPTPGTGTR